MAFETAGQSGDPAMVAQQNLTNARGWQDGGVPWCGNQEYAPKALLMPMGVASPCDGSFKTMAHGEINERKSGVFVRFQSSTPDVLGGDLLLASSPGPDGLPGGSINPEYEWFRHGTTSQSSGNSLHLYSRAPAVGTLLPGEGSPFVLSQADTDAISPKTSNDTDLALLTSDQSVDFFVCSLQVEVVGFYESRTQYATGASDGPAVRQPSDWLYRDEGAYRKRMTDFIYKHGAIVIERNGQENAQNTMVYRLSSSGDWPSYSDMVGTKAQTPGTPMPFAMRNLLICILMGRRPKVEDNDVYRIKLIFDSNGIIDNSPANPVPAGLSSETFTGQNPLRGSIFAEVRLKMGGGMVCVDRTTGVPIMFQGGLASPIDQMIATYAARVPGGSMILALINNGSITKEAGLAQLKAMAGG